LSWLYCVYTEMVFKSKGQCRKKKDVVSKAIVRANNALTDDSSCPHVVRMKNVRTAFK